MHSLDDLVARARARRSRKRGRAGWRRRSVAASLSACAAVVAAATTCVRWWMGTGRPFERARAVETVESASGASGTVRMEDVCVYSPSTTERARAALPRLASTWEGTISVAVLANVSDAREVVSVAKLLGDL